MRSEATQFVEAIDKTLLIGRGGKVPVNIHHLKAGGQSNWHKMHVAIGKIGALRKEGILATADMYRYVAEITGLDASTPPWVQAGGYDKWTERLQDPEIRECGQNPMDTIIDLVIEDGSRIGKEV